MSLCYKISPGLNMVLYIGEGLLRPSDFFALEKTVFLEHQRKCGMITLVDLLEASTFFDLDDIHRFIDNIRGMAKNGMEPGPYIMLTKDRGLHLLADAAQLMASGIDLKARMYDTLRDAITALGLSDCEPEIIQLWSECKLESSKSRAHLSNINNLKPAAQNSVDLSDAE